MLKENMEVALEKTVEYTGVPGYEIFGERKLLDIVYARMLFLFICAFRLPERENHKWPWSLRVDYIKDLFGFKTTLRKAHLKKYYYTRARWDQTFKERFCQDMNKIVELCDSHFIK
jgi:hypothetical protein